MTSIFDSKPFTESLFFQRRDISHTPAGAKDLWITVADGVRLHLRHHRSKGSMATVLLFHGNGEVVSDYDQHAPAWAELARADLAIVDYRGYGQSEGSPTLRHCITDAHAVAGRFARESPVAPLFIMGRSLGSACAAELARARAPVAHGVIIESGAADLRALIRRRGIHPPEVITEQDLADFCPLRKLRQCELPALVLHGAQDRSIAADEARQTFEALATRSKALVLVPDRGHNDIATHPMYWEALSRFVLTLAEP